MRLGKASVGSKVGGSHHTACGQLGTMNPVIAGKRLRYLGSRFDLNIVEQLEPKPGISPSPAHLAQVVTTMRNTGAFLAPTRFIRILTAINQF